MSAFTRVSPHILVISTFVVLVGLLFSLLLEASPSYAESPAPLPLRLDDRPFSPDLCTTTGGDRPIQLHVMRHRDVIINRVEGQYIPANPNQARTKEYIHYVTLKDLTDGIQEEGGIAFNRHHAVIFTPDHPKGLARQAFLNSLPSPQRALTERALDTFLRLHPVLNAAIDTCRPYPPFVTYGTDDEIDRIEAGRYTFAQRARAFNANSALLPRVDIPDPGLEDGFVDPSIGRRSNVSYHAMNPLNFYVPTP